MPTTTTTRRNISSICPLPITTTHKRGATPHHDRHPATAGKYHAPPAAGELSRGRKTSSV